MCPLERKKRIEKNVKNKNISFITMALIVGVILVGCRNHIRIMIDYRHAPIIPDLKEKTILIGDIKNRCEIFDAGSDLQAMIVQEAEKHDVFKDIHIVRIDDITQMTPDEFQLWLDQAGTFPWSKWKDSLDGDLLLIGMVSYSAQDRSGYDSVWQTTSTGYRVPAKVWKDRIAYEFSSRLLLVDLNTWTVISDKTYSDNSSVESASDEVGVFYDIMQIKMLEFLDYIEGKEVKSHRYLLLK